MRRVVGAALAVVALVVSASASAPAEGTGDGTVLAFGTAAFKGSPADATLAAPLVAMARTPSGQGYWLAGADGGIFSFGDAGFFGSTGDMRLNRPIVAMAATPSGQGYWLAASDGGVFTFGDAGFFGSTADMRLNRPVVAMAASPTGLGYWLVAADGGMFTFGDARFFGSTGDLRLNRPVTGMTTTPAGDGYWLVAADGGIFTFGDAGYLGSPPASGVDAGASGMAATPTGRGYWVAGRDGNVDAYGDAAVLGTGTGQVPAGRAVVAVAAASGGGGYWLLASTRPLVITPGTVDPSVTSIQERLNSLGYWVPVTGVFDAVTTQAVYALQKVNGLQRTGQVGPEEMAALAAGVRVVPRSTSGYVVEVDKTRQIIIVARDGLAELVFNTSTGNGRRYASRGSRGIAVTPEGRFTIDRQINGLRISALGELFRPKYFVGGYAIHGSPSIPPFPASHGCVRVSNAAINFIWANAVMPLGTPLWSYS